MPLPIFKKNLAAVQRSMHSMLYSCGQLVHLACLAVGRYPITLQQYFASHVAVDISRQSGQSTEAAGEEGLGHLEGVS